MAQMSISEVNRIKIFSFLYLPFAGIKAVGDGGLLTSGTLKT